MHIDLFHFKALKSLKNSTFFGWGALKSLNFLFVGILNTLLQMSVNISVEKFGHVYEISQIIVFAAFPMKWYYFKITINNNRTVLENVYFFLESP